MSIVNQDVRGEDPAQATKAPERDYEAELAALRTDRNRWRAEAEKLSEQFQNTPTIDRSYLLTKGTMRQRQTYHALAKEVKAADIQRRRELGQKYLAEQKLESETSKLVVLQKDGFASVDLSHHPLVQDAIKECRDTYQEAIDSGKELLSKDSLEFVGDAGWPFIASGGVYKLATSPLLLAPVIRYFGMFPIMTGFGLLSARNEEFYPHSSQRLHFDPEDRTQLKVFFYITDVDETSGPFMAVPAEDSAVLYNDPDFKLARQDDTAVREGSIRTFTGPAGTAIYCDTCRCLHAGARPGGKKRLMLSIEYNIPTHLNSKLWEGDPTPERRCRTLKVRDYNLNEYTEALLAHPKPA
ncbi:hypothetical protein D1224_05710 [Henriciella barbarensis]|uniref:Phytanoyl-CoA dioxygenase n=1 Tax=Henriciella barbarensis TaxID=86342 RepID=A0A399QXA9_9PROT|nr:hypothetical protein [Henriciella barbarensis]RIJ23756.1 hypothetical protein D1224_05710 [Henriciella barbarensis]